MVRRRRRSNPRRRFRARRRRNPGFFSGLLAPVKEHGIGFAVGAAANHYAVEPLLMQFLPADAVAPSKILVGPLLANLGKRFIPSQARHLDSVAIFMVACGIKETLDAFVFGAPKTATKGLGYGYGARGIGSIGPTGGMRGLGSIGPTSGTNGLGSLGYAEESYTPYQSDGSY